jgi:hypothetical protein
MKHSLLGDMLAQQAARSRRRTDATDRRFRFLYFNHMNLALRTSLKTRNQVRCNCFNYFIVFMFFLV